MQDTTFLYEVLLRGNETGLVGAHVVRMRRITDDSGVVLVDQPGPAEPLNVSEVAGVLGGFAGAAAQVTELSTELATARERIEELLGQISALQQPSTPAGETIAAAYFKQALANMGKLDAANAAAEAAGKGVLWSYAIEINPADADIMAAASAIGVDLAEVMIAARALRSARLWPS